MRAPRRQANEKVAHHGARGRRRGSPTTLEAMSTADDTSPLHGVSWRLAERQVQTPPWCLEYWPGGYTMARLAREIRGMAARAHGGGTDVVLCHLACAMSAHDCVGRATRRFP